jgi:hypothetical protein
VGKKSPEVSSAVPTRRAVSTASRPMRPFISFVFIGVSQEILVRSRNRHLAKCLSYLRNARFNQNQPVSLPNFASTQAFIRECNTLWALILWQCSSLATPSFRMRGFQSVFA